MIFSNSGAYAKTYKKITLSGFNSDVTANEMMSAFALKTVSAVSNIHNFAFVSNEDKLNSSNLSLNN